MPGSKKGHVQKGCAEMHTLQDDMLHGAVRVLGNPYNQCDIAQYLQGGIQS